MRGENYNPDIIICNFNGMIQDACSAGYIQNYQTSEDRIKLIVYIICLNWLDESCISNLCSQCGNLQKIKLMTTKTKWNF